MKKTIIPAILLVLSLASCKKGFEYKDILLFTGTQMNPEVGLYIDGPSSKAYSITSSCVVSEDVEVFFEPDSTVMRSFNEANKTNYDFMPAELYELSASSVKIPSGSAVSAPFEVSIPAPEKFEPGITYCLPLKITGASNAQMPVPGKDHIFIVIRSYRYSSASVLTRTKAAYYHMPKMSADPALNDLPGCTMMIRTKINSFQPNTNPYITSLIGVEENFLLRFGDITCQPDQLQLAGRGVSITVPTPFETGKWYHIAVVDDRSMARFYVNGVLVHEGSTLGKRPINLGFEWMDCFHIGFSERGRYFDGIVSEASVWGRALSQTEIINNECALARPEQLAETSGLIGYWRLDDVNRGADLSGHGYDGTPYNVTFTEKNSVRCPQ